MDTAVIAMNTAPLATREPVFRFYDNRQKYLLFVNTCSEKWVVAQRVAMELGNIYPRPPAIRIFDAGVGDGTVLTRVMRAEEQLCGSRKQHPDVSPGPAAVAHVRGGQRLAGGHCSCQRRSSPRAAGLLRPAGA